MNRSSNIFLLILASLLSITASCQLSFKTVVPQRPIAIDESFQVQYIIENANEISNFSVPPFAGFRVVSGPNAYADKQNSSRKNLVLTLAALKMGKWKIPGASCVVNGKMITSNDAFVTVVPLQETDESAYFLKPGEDPYKKIQQNLFLKLSVDRQSCFVGEPIVATFKLYSRVQSKSNIIKNPGFYGFSVYDMVDVNDKVESQERLNGHWFDVHTIRKLQLYPLEAGIFTVDAMELANVVEFSEATTGKKSKQSVSENMYNSDAAKAAGNAKEYETKIKSQPVVINVKALPGKNPADTFEGAVGNFSINAYVERDSILKNQEDSFVVEINGGGNFQRVNPPVIQLPSNFEVFEPSVKDTFDKQKVPLAGQRRFKYVFVSNQPGFYTIPAVSFTFFNPRALAYQTISTEPKKIFVSARSKTYRTQGSPVASVTKKDIPWLPIGVSVGIIAVGLIVWLLTRKKSREPIKEQPEIIAVPVQTQLSVLLMPAREAIGKTDKVFYEALDRGIWEFFRERLQDFNSQMIKKDLANILTSRGVEPQLINRQLDIIHRCETGIYTNVNLEFDKNALLKEAEETLNKINSGLDSARA